MEAIKAEKERKMEQNEEMMKKIYKWYAENTAHSLEELATPKDRLKVGKTLLKLQKIFHEETQEMDLWLRK